MTELNQPENSPPWGSTTKLVIGLTVVAIVSALLVNFRAIIGPLILSFILTYLLHPLANYFSLHTRLSWRAAVNLIFILLIILVLGFFTVTGVAIVQQFESLIGVVRRFINEDLIQIIENLSEQTYSFGIFQFDLSQLNLDTISQQILTNLQATLGQAGSLIGTIASGAVGILGWSLFVLLIAYFLLADSRRVPSSLNYIDIPGYSYDFRRMGRELGRIWNAYLRGQLVIVIMVSLSSLTLMTALGVRYALGIALLTGLARFVPYIGSLTTNTVTFLVAFFQVSNYFGLPSLYFALIVVAVGMTLDQVFDNYINPRLLGQALGVHPAAVLVAAILAANLIGLVGLVLAAPVLATLRLFGRYTVRKLFDLDPWPEEEQTQPPIEWPWTKLLTNIKEWLKNRQTHQKTNK